MQTDWMKDPTLTNIDSYKLEFLQALVFEGSSLNKDQMLPFLMAIAKRGQEKKINFTDEEMNAVITVLKMHSSPEELTKMDKIMTLMRTRK